MDWKKGRGALGPFKPLLGSWRTQSGTGPRCLRTFTELWGSNYVRLDARWEMGPGKAYEEIALFGKDRSGALAFWSFTSDGKQAQGGPTDASDVHPEAIAFAAEMPAGTARFVYWPADDEGFLFAVESKTKSGWNRFVRHHYLPA
jgi:hypothetical protein